MQLTSHPVTTKELLKFMSLDSTEGTEGVISGDDYINNINRRKTNKVDVIVLRHYFSGFFCDFISYLGSLFKFIYRSVICIGIHCYFV